MMSVMSLYAKWLDMCAAEPDLMRELSRIRDDRQAIEDRFYADLSFGTGGMRGVIGAGINRINLFTIRRAAAGLADWLSADPGSRGKPVVIAHDSRLFSARFARETALVLAGRGVRALLFDALRPVPVLSFAVRHLNAAAGVVITASHNPPQYNGFKVYGPDGAQLAPQAADIVTENIRRLDFEACLPMEESRAREQGLLADIGRKEVDDAYTKMALRLMVRPDLVRALGGELSIVYTPLHGSGNVPVRRVLNEAGFGKVTVVPEQEMPDPAFPTVKAPNPEDPASFTLAIPLAERTGATVIFGTDPDCDRLGVCVRDREGVFRTLTGNQIGCLLLHHVLSEKKRMGLLPKDGAAAKSIVSSELARAICEDFGVTLFDVLTGFKFIGELIQQFEETGGHTFLFGFEESFGYLSGTSVRDKDAVNAALLTAEAACVCLHEGITLYERLQQIYQKYGFFSEAVLSRDYPGKQGAEQIRHIMQALREAPPDRIAGLRVLAVRDYLSGRRKENGLVTDMGLPVSDVLFFELEQRHWFCIRPSGTEPKIKLYTAVSHRESMEKAQSLGRQLTGAVLALLEG